MRWPMRVRQNDMTPYTIKEIECILQTGYYDRRTDYVWKTVIGEDFELVQILYSITSLESNL